LQFLGEAERRAALCDEAYELATASGDVRAVFAALNAFFYSYPYRLFDRAMGDAYLDTYRAIMPAVIESGDDYRIGIGLHEMWYYAVGLGRPDIAAHVDELAHEQLERRPTRFLQRQCANRALMGALLRGDHHDATARLRDLEALEPDVAANQLHAFFLALEGGYVEITLPVIEQALETVAQRRFLEGVLVTALVETGDLERANAVVDANLDAGIDTVPEDTLYNVTVALIVEAAIRLRRRDRAADLERWVDATGVDIAYMSGIGYLGSTHRLRGGIAHLRGDDEAAAAHFRAAIEFEQRNGAIPMLVAARLGWADMLADRGDLEGATALARTALDDIGDLPLLRLQRRANAVLADAQAVP
jgi:tetratricopeptide (TPR) repeat protein